MSFIFSILLRFLRYLKDFKSIYKDPIIRIAEPDQNQSAAMTLEKLPVDIMQHIARFLTLDSVASLIFSSKSLRWAIGHQSWVVLKSKARCETRLSFLFSLQRDLREWVLCFYCVKLHCVKQELAWHKMWSHPDDLPCTRADGVVYLLPGYYLRFQHAQMAMKLFKLGAADNIWLRLLCYSNWYINQTYHDCCARVVCGNLLLKVEYRLFLHEGQSYRQARHTFPHVCPHFLRCHNKAYRCQFSDGVCHGCAECVGLTQCRVCGTEIAIAYSYSDKVPNGRAVHITAWKNLGQCDTPVDPCWRTQVDPFYSTFLTQRNVALWRRGSIRKAFEGLGSSEATVGRLMSM